MTPVRCLVMAIVTGWVVAPGPVCAQGDRARAEDEYRVARRLAAEGSPAAAEALRRVVTLDPGGPLGDDALIDMARLEGVAGWPEELGRLAPQRAQRVVALLEELIRDYPRGDRLTEARFLLALTMLEPLASRDVRRARVGLLDLATDPASGPFGRRARYVTAWIDETGGEIERAAAAYERLFLDGYDDPVAVRAAAGAGRGYLGVGAWSAAAVWLQRAVDLGQGPGSEAARLRELAMRGTLLGVPGAGSWSAGQPSRWSSGGRPDALATFPGGDRLIQDRRAGEVVRHRSEGGVVARWPLPDLEAVTVGPLGRAYAAAGGRLYLLADRAVPIAQLGDYAPVSALAVDGSGSVWLADRKGERVARIPTDGTSPAAVWEDRQVRIAGLAWNGRTILALDERGGRLLSLDASGSPGPFGPTAFRKPTRLTALPVGVAAVVDARASSIVIVGPQGEVETTIPLQILGVAKPADLAMRLDGSIDVLDGGSGSVVTAP